MQYLGSIFFYVVFDRLHVIEWGSKTSNIFLLKDNGKEFWWMFVTVITTVMTKKWLNLF